MLHYRTFLVLLLLVLGAGCGYQDTATTEGGPAAEYTPQGPPDWFAGHTLYEVHVRACSPEGDFAGVRSRLDHLEQLGRPNLLLVPVTLVGGDRMGQLGNIYATADHRAVDPSQGSLDDLKALVADAHDRGMRLLLDLVLPFAAVDHVQLSAHPDWFTRDEKGLPTRRMTRWPDIVDFDLKNPEARAYLVDSVRFWVDEVGVDGFRFPLPLLAPDDFWRELIATLKAEHPQLALLMESADPRYLAMGYDAHANPEMKGAMDFCRMDDLAQVGVVEDVWKNIWRPQDHPATWGAPVNFLEDHTHDRSSRYYPPEFLSGFAAVVFTVPGTPQLLMGQEIGSRAEPHPIHPWQVDWSAADERFLKIYRELIALRAASAALRGGDFRREGQGPMELMTYSRTLGDEIVFCAANLTNGKPVFTLPERLAAERWQEWDGEKFAGEAVVLTGEQKVEPGSYRVWRRVGS